mmetsp:Transcript_96835/g.172315  ORF Transcript_96835/g.172315 Transcript_96835/m.172315 type:complete len:372 (+) Transcript_96835:40-1155(+)
MVRVTTTALREADAEAEATKVNQYRVQQVVGRGTYCQVKWAVDDNGRGYALKDFSRNVLERRRVARFDANGASTVALGERIEEEVRILEQLAHPQVMCLEEVIDDPDHGWFYMVLEGLAGGQIMSWDEGSCAYSVNSDSEAVNRLWGAAVQGGDSLHPVVAVFSEDFARYLFRQVVEGLAYLHEKEVVHKDLKPDNILLSNPTPCDARFVQLLNLSAWPQLSARAAGGAALGEVLASGGVAAKIGDFNTAALCSAPDFLIYDAEGTVQFTPPECFMDSQSGVRGKPRDVWSLGCTFFVMLFGRCPFWATENIFLQLKIMQEDLELPTGRESVSPAALDFLQTSLQKEPSLRPTCQQLLETAWLKEPDKRIS